MAGFKFTDKRGSGVGHVGSHPAEPKLITSNLQSELNSAKNERLNQITGPRDQRARVEYNQRVDRNLSGNLSQSVRTADVHRRNAEMLGGMKRTSSSVEMAYEKKREPLETVKGLGIHYDELDEEETRKQIRDWCRGYYVTHPLVSLCVDIYTRFPIQGMHLTSKDPQLQEFYEQLFFDQLEYEDFLIDFGREFWVTGEVTSLANFNETLGVWDDEEILNPDGIDVTYSNFERDYDYQIEVPEYLRQIIETQTPSHEYKNLVEVYPELVKAVRGEEKLAVSSTLMSRAINKMNPWDVYGTPHMLRSFRQLMMEEGLNAAQDAIADRLYAPFILAKLGTNDAGDGQPWIPTPEDLQNFNQDINQALAADFKLLTHHFAVDIQSVFGRESMPRFDNDYDRLERKQLQVWGIGESLISGSSNGAYASSALNRDLLTQMMTSWQKKIVKHYRRRAEVVAEAQGHYDYELKGGVRTPIYEEVLEIDEETGKTSVVKRPKLLIPDLEFQALNLRDENTERQFLQSLKAAGLPISDRTLSANIDIDFDDEVEKSVGEKVQKVVAEEEFKQKVREVLEAKELQVPPQFMEMPPMVPPPGAPQGPPPGAGGPQGPPSEKGPQGGGADGPPGGVLQLPQNPQRPPESDEYRGESVASRYASSGPSVVGLRSKVSEDEVEKKVRDGYQGRGGRKKGEKFRREIRRSDPSSRLRLQSTTSEQVAEDSI